jgi:hypothetical protein
MYPALPYELTQAHIADLHRQTGRGRIADRTRRARSASHRYTGTARRPAALVRLRARLTVRTPRSTS